MTNVSASAVVAVRNDEAGIAACVDALLRQTVPIEIIVVDDGSTDGTGARAELAGARVLRTEGVGAGGARNQGVLAASTSIILFTDGDCVPDPEWAERLIAELDDGVVASKGIYRTEQRSSTAQFVQLEYEERYARMARCMERDGAIDFLDTYSLAVDRDAFLSIGGFDESFRGASVEDQEMAFRLAKVGPFRFAEDAVVAHRHAADPIAYVRKKFKIGRGKATVLRRHRDRAGSDSHTPSSLRWQLPCVAAAVGCGPLAAVALLLGRAGWCAALLAAVLLLGVVAPSLLSAGLLSAARRRHGVRFACAATGLVVSRAWALTGGFLYGIPVPEVALGEVTRSRLTALPEPASTEPASTEPASPICATEEERANDREGLRVR